MNRKQTIDLVNICMFVFGILFEKLRTESSFVDVAMFGLAVVYFFWFGRIEKTKPKIVYYG